MNLSPTDIIAMIAALSALAGVIYNYRMAKTERRVKESDAEKTHSDAVESVSKATLTLLEPLRERIAQLEKMTTEFTAKLQNKEDAIWALESEVKELQYEVDKLQQNDRFRRSEIQKLLERVTKLRAGVNRLILQVRALGHVPVYTPDDDDGLDEIGEHEGG